MVWRMIGMKARLVGIRRNMSFLLCTIFLKSVLISRSPPLSVLRKGAVSFLTDSGRREAWLLCMQAGAQNQWDV